MSAETTRQQWAQVEQKRLHNAVDKLAAAMKQKLDKKLSQGFSGGLDRCPPADLIKMAQEHLDRLARGDELQDVDVAKFMAFLFAQRGGS